MIHWEVHKLDPRRPHMACAEAERQGRGTFLPTRAVVSYSDGKRSSHECPVFVGYGFIERKEEKLQSVYGRDNRPITKALGLVSEAEMKCIVLGHATGLWNEVATGEPIKRARTRRRRPRPGKRWRGQGRAAA